MYLKCNYLFTHLIIDIFSFHILNHLLSSYHKIILCQKEPILKISIKPTIKELTICNQDLRVAGDF